MVRWTSPTIQFEYLATHALCSPKVVGCCHFLDQGHCLKREPGLPRIRLGCVLAQHTEEFTRPSLASSAAGQGKAPLCRFEPCWRGAPEEVGPSLGMLVASLVDAG